MTAEKETRPAANRPQNQTTIDEDNLLAPATAVNVVAGAAPIAAEQAAGPAINVLPRFYMLIPPLQEVEKRQLEENLVKDGCLDPLVTWNGFLIDGHNRFEICQRRGIPFKTVEVNLPSEDHAAVWIRFHQLGRRNLSDDQRAIMADAALEEQSALEKRERAVKAVTAREQKAGRKPILSNTPTDKITAPKKDTRAAVSKQVKLSERKLRTARAVRTKAPELAKRVEAGEITLAEADRQAKKDQRQSARIEAAKGQPHDNRIILGDFRIVGDQIKDGTVDLIFTDPPYNRKSIGLYGDLAKFGADKLTEGGSLVAYCGQYLLPEIIALMEPHLRFWWIFACTHSGPLARMREYGIQVAWKPLLWFVKGTRGDKETFIADLVDGGGKEKNDHDWQQAVSEAEYFISKLSPLGGFVADPLLGGGTTAVASARLKRRWIGIEIDETTVKLASARLAERPSP